MTLMYLERSVSCNENNEVESNKSFSLQMIESLIQAQIPHTSSSYQ